VPVVVLSHRTWQRQGGDPNIVGTQVSVNGILCQVIGVAPERFTGTALIGPDLWLPLGVHGLVTGQDKDKPAQATSYFWDYPWLVMVGRLKPGLSLSTAETLLPALASRLKERFPDRREMNCTLYLHRPARLSAYKDSDQKLVSTGSLFLMGVSAIILLIACLNLANMYVVQGASRHREIAIRMAIGGGRMRIIRQFFVESLLLALLGGAFGLVLAFWGTKVLNTLLAALWFSVETGLAVEASLDARVVAATLGFCLIAALLSGLRPALRLSRRDLIGDLKESRGRAPRPARARGIMPRGLSVAGQVALSVALIMSASLLTHSAWTAARMTPGYSFDDKLLIEVEPRRAGSAAAGNLQLCERLMDRLNTLPGVQAVGLSTSMPLQGWNPFRHIWEYRTESDDEMGRLGRSTLSIVRSIGGDYFQAMDLPLLRGRYFSRMERATDAPVAIIDEVQARRLRPDGNALGCLISGIGPKPREVIGIVPAVRSYLFAKELDPHVYTPTGRDLESFDYSVYLFVRTTHSTAGGETALLQSIPREIHRVDPHVAILSLRTLADYHRQSRDVRQARLVAGLAMAFAAMALFLAALGIYGVKGYLVAARTPEIGIRMALGATSGKILTLVLREGATLTLVGLSLGMLLAFGAARVMSHALCGVDPVDPVSIAATLALLGAASLLASYVPARRAAKVDPMVALRCE
jgi:predicted permease